MNPIYQHIKRLTFELSNLCNLSTVHVKCPSNKVQQKLIMPETIVYDVLDFFGSEFDGMVCFHRYNEPTYDPRLMMFIDVTIKKCPKSHIHLISNGMYYNQTLEDEFKKHGVKTISITPYPETELDDRLKIYDLPENDCKIPCRAPYSDLTMLCTGDIGLCCWDWKNTIMFGNVFKEQLGDILESERMINTFKRLSSGDRFNHVCRRCFVTR